jgi:hypothetical protein
MLALSLVSGCSLHSGLEPRSARPLCLWPVGDTGMKIFPLLIAFGLTWPAIAGEPWRTQNSPIRIELDVFSGRPNPTWNLNDEQSREFLIRFGALKKYRTNRKLYEGLGYRGFTVTGFQDYDRVTIWDGLVQTNRATEREKLIDEAGRLERFLLETSKGQIDGDLYRFVASVAGKQATRK